MPDEYESLDFKIPVESDDYMECSDYVIHCIDSIMKNAIDTKQNQIIINTNLRLGIPMENVNKVAGPLFFASENSPKLQNIFPRRRWGISG